jgi:hypothetical protein
MFSDQDTLIFYSPIFPIIQVLKYTFLQKKLLKIIFGALREYYLKQFD